MPDATGHVQPARHATRYEAAKLYLMGKCAEQAQRLAHRVIDALARDDDAPPAGRVPDHARIVYDGGYGCLGLLFRMKELSAGVLPWAVVQGLNEACADLAAHAQMRDREDVLADARLVIDRIDRLERLVVPDWDVRAKD